MEEVPPRTSLAPLSYLLRSLTCLEAKGCEISRGGLPLYGGNFARSYSVSRYGCLALLFG